MEYKRLKNKKDRLLTGFTLIELLVVIAIIFILSSVMVANFGAARGQLALKRAAHQMVQDLRRAQEMAMSSAQLEEAESCSCLYGSCSGTCQGCDTLGEADCGTTYPGCSWTPGGGSNDIGGTCGNGSCSGNASTCGSSCPLGCSWSGSGICSSKGYGIYLNISADNKSYKLYADTAGDEEDVSEWGYYTPADCIVKTINIQEKGVIIKEINTPNQKVSINFKPPNPDINIKWLQDNKNEVEIVLALETDQSKTKTVVINRAGMLEIR